MPDSWETFRTSLSNSAPDGVITVDLAKSSFLNEEMRRKSQGSFAQSDILVIEKNGRSKSRGPKFKERGRSKSNKFTNVECYNCGMKGHISRLCRKPKKENKKDNGKEKAKDDENGDDRVSAVTGDFLIVHEYDVVHLAFKETSSVVDSGASIHATSRKDLSHPTRLVIFGNVKMGDDGLAKTIGTGDLCLKTSNGT